MAFLVFEKSWYPSTVTRAPSLLAEETGGLGVGEAVLSLDVSGTAYKCRLHDRKNRMALRDFISGYWRPEA